MQLTSVNGGQWGIISVTHKHLDLPLNPENKTAEQKEIIKACPENEHLIPFSFFSFSFFLHELALRGELIVVVYHVPIFN